jgi:hypothetical protein
MGNSLVTEFIVVEGAILCFHLLWTMSWSTRTPMRPGESREIWLIHSRIRGLIPTLVRDKEGSMSVSYQFS